MRTTKLVAGIACIAFLIETSPGRAAEDYVLISQQSAARFKCAVLAAHSRYNAEEKRLFAFGLKEARIVIDASRARLISSSEYARMEFVWPLVLRVWSFQPPDSPTDFVAGQVYESIWESTTSDLGDR